MNVVVLIVDGSIASLNVADTVELTATPVAPSAGIVDTTVGAVVSPAVNENDVCAIALPCASFTPVPTVTI